MRLTVCASWYSGWKHRNNWTCWQWDGAVCKVRDPCSIFPGGYRAPRTYPHMMNPLREQTKPTVMWECLCAAAAFSSFAEPPRVMTWHTRMIVPVNIHCASLQQNVYMKWHWMSQYAATRNKHIKKVDSCSDRVYGIVNLKIVKVLTPRWRSLSTVCSFHMACTTPAFHALLPPDAQTQRPAPLHCHRDQTTVPPPALTVYWSALSVGDLQLLPPK